MEELPQNSRRRVVFSIHRKVVKCWRHMHLIHIVYLRFRLHLHILYAACVGLHSRARPKEKNIVLYTEPQTFRVSFQRDGYENDEWTIRMHRRVFITIKASTNRAPNETRNYKTEIITIILWMNVEMCEYAKLRSRCRNERRIKNQKQIKTNWQKRKRNGMYRIRHSAYSACSR